MRTTRAASLKGKPAVSAICAGNFGSGQEFYTSWFDHRSEYKTDEFKTVLDEVVNALREKNGLLCTRDSMTKFCYQRPEAEFEGNYLCAEYGFKVQTPQHPICSDATPIMETTIFTSTPTLPDSWNTTWKRPNRASGLSRPATRSCSVSPMATTSAFSWRWRNPRPHLPIIDETHVEIGSDWHNLYHICQFAEMMERNGNAVIPLRSSLPVQCFSVLPSSGELILLTRGEKGYSPCYDFSTPDAQQNREFADDRNVKNGVTKAQEAAMLAGSMFGWQTPAADPRNYDEQGQPIKPRQKDRGEAR